MQFALRKFIRGDDPFQGLGLDTLEKKYRWDRAERASRYIEIEPNSSRYEIARSLRAELSRLWQVHPERRGEIALFFVSNWGGFNAYRKSIFARHLANAQSALPRTSFTGIATLSKILSLRNPEQFATYDFRVAISLMAIQILDECGEGLCLPIPHGRDNVLEHPQICSGFVQDPRFRRASLLNRFETWHAIRRDSAYDIFLYILARHAQMEGASIADLEMSLFASAEDLVERLYAKEGDKAPRSTVLPLNGRRLQ